MSAMGADRVGAEHSFSYLYLANVLGAVAGAVFPLLLIEQVGFVATLRFGTMCNLAVAATAFALGRQVGPTGRLPREQDVAAEDYTSGEQNRRNLGLLFATGLTSMAVEVVWIRLFTPYVGTVVYSFAAILGMYLVGTFLGTRFYRRWGHQDGGSGLIWLFLGICGALPLLPADPTLAIPGLLRVVVGVVPLAVAAGFATPMLVDRQAGGDPELAGSAYAINILGCVLGPLIAAYLLLPHMSERRALALPSLPWFVVGCSDSLSGSTQRIKSPLRRMLAPVSLTFAGLFILLTSRSFEAQFWPRRVLRDSTATVIATGAGAQKHLLVNGVGMTSLTPVTKMMAHLPLAFLDKPRSMLIVCFGMGTTHRSALSWGINSTAVELVPSVPKMFSFFHADGEQLLRSSRSRVTIDDGRRYLEWAPEKYDVITLDPPPPVEAAASSLLYSREFYEIAKRHLRRQGIVQQWLPTADDVTIAAVTRAFRDSFPYVRAFRSVEDWGIHFLGSMQPFPAYSASHLAGHLPPAAVTDLVEWGPEVSAEGQFGHVLRNELSIDQLIAKAPKVPPLEDNRPINEYYLVRRVLR